MAEQEYRFKCPKCGSIYLEVVERNYFAVGPDGTAWKDTGYPDSLVWCQTCGEDLDDYFEVEYNAGDFTVIEKASS